MKPIIIISACLLWMASCHPADNVEPPIDHPVVPPVVEPPIEVGTPLLFEPNEAVTITVADETFTVDFSRSRDIQALFDATMSGSALMGKTREAYMDRYRRQRGYFVGAIEAASYAEIDFVQLEYTLAQECFSDRCPTEIRKEVLQLVLEKQKPKYGLNSYGESVYYGYAIQTGVFLLAVILVKEWEQSVDFIDHETLQQALLFLNDFDHFTEYPMYYGVDFSDLIVRCAQNFLTDNK